MILDLSAMVVLHAGCAVVYAALCALILAGRPLSRTAAWLALACFVTALWAVAVVRCRLSRRSRSAVVETLVSIVGPSPRTPSLIQDSCHGCIRVFPPFPASRAGRAHACAQLTTKGCRWGGGVTPCVQAGSSQVLQRVCTVRHSQRHADEHREGDDLPQLY